MSRPATAPRPPTAPALAPGAAEALDLALAGFAAAPRVLVALDFDGTIAHLSDDPYTVRPVAGAAAVLGALAADPGTRLALVSGRPARDLAELAGAPPGALLVGSHGAERGAVTSGGGVVVGATQLSAMERRRYRAVEEALAGLADGRDGVWVERKPLGLALHTRRAPRAAAEAATRAALEGPAGWPGVYPIRGKDVVEIAVRRSTKGGAVAELRTVAGHRLPVLYAGDDVTDETALATLGPADVGIRVGPGPTHAAHRVRDPEALVARLASLAALRSGWVEPRPPR